MSTYLLLIASVSCGIDAGWQPGPDGGVEYTLQLDDRAFALLKSGEILFSDVMPNLRDVRKIRITSGSDKLARLDPAPGTEMLVAKKPTATESPEKVAADKTDDPNAAKSHLVSYPNESNNGSEADRGFLGWSPWATGIGLFASIGANLFLIWSLAGAYRQNRRLARRTVKP